MAWWGKVIGGSLGFLMGGPLGIALGALAGHFFDKGMNQQLEEDVASSSDQEQLQAAFFTATFVSMGRLAKSDGLVTSDEIEKAQQIMQRIGLDQTMKQAAIALFKQGKESDFDWQGAINQFAVIAGRQRNLKQMFLEIQIEAAFADGELHTNEKEMLSFIASALGFSRLKLEQLILMVMAQNAYYEKQYEYGHSKNHYQYDSAAQASPKQEDIKLAYDILGISSQASKDDIKKAYRRLMSQHHPDKLVAKGLPEEMIKIATEKTKEIKMAYEILKKHHNF